MRKRRWVIILLTTILLAVFYAVTAQSLVYASPSESISHSSTSLTMVPPAGSLVVPDDFPTIQAAVGNASAGDTVFVRNGSYKERITIDKPLSLIGEDRQNTVIGGAPVMRFSNSFVVRVTAENVMISGFTIKKDMYGIWIDKESYQSPLPSCRIIGNNIEDNYVNGILIHYGNNHVITGNNITGNGGDGISVSSSNSIISENYITGNKEKGISVSRSAHITINRNNIMGNGKNGSSSDRGGLVLEWTGPYYVYENNITDNPGYGIVFARGCSNAHVYANNIEHNSVGVALSNFKIGGDAIIGSGNNVYRNNIINNVRQVFVEKEYPYARNLNYTEDNATDIVSWDNSKEGNYWSDYQSRYPNAVEVDASGIGDTAYVIDENNVDHYPLMQPVDISKASPTPSPPESYSTELIVGAVISVVVISIGLLFYFKKRKR